MFKLKIVAGSSNFLEGAVQSGVQEKNGGFWHNSVLYLINMKI